MIPASEEFIKNKENWDNVHIREADREETICLHIIDPEICQGLGKALESIYQPSDAQDQEFVQAYKRLVRSIRYLVDRFFHRFVNLFDKGLNFSEEIFEPEDVIFLASSFESLFNIDNSQEAAADFKHKLRPLLHLKYSRPVEIFWKWVDDFYEVKRRILHGDTFLDPLFRLNPNFEVSHILLGIKLFVYLFIIIFLNIGCSNLRMWIPIPLLILSGYTPKKFCSSSGQKLQYWRRFIFLLEQSEGSPLKEESLADMNLLTLYLFRFMTAIFI